MRVLLAVICLGLTLASVAWGESSARATAAEKCSGAFEALLYIEKKNNKAGNDTIVPGRLTFSSGKIEFTQPARDPKPNEGFKMPETPKGQARATGDDWVIKATVEGIKPDDTATSVECRAAIAKIAVDETLASLTSSKTRSTGRRAVRDRRGGKAPGAVIDGQPAAGGPPSTGRAAE